MRLVRAREKCERLERELRKCPDFQLYLLSKARKDRVANLRKGNTRVRSPGHHVEGGSVADIFVVRSATRWLRLKG
jgi:hypothetical protein